MDIGTAFLLGVLVGQWVLLFVIWRALSRLVTMIAAQEASEMTGREIVAYQYPKDDYFDGSRR